MTDTILNIHTDFFNQRANHVYHTIEQELQLAMDRFLHERKLQRDFDNGLVWFEDQVEIILCNKDGRIEDSEIYIDMPEYIGNRKDSDKHPFDQTDVEDIHHSNWHSKTEEIYRRIVEGYSSTDYLDATDVSVSVRALYDDGSEYGETIDYASFVFEFKAE